MERSLHERLTGRLEQQLAEDRAGIQQLVRDACFGKRQALGDVTANLARREQADHVFQQLSAALGLVIVAL